MPNEFREITRRSWGNRILGSFVGILIGLVLFIGSFPLLWWNEGRSLNRIKTLEEGRNLVVEAGQTADPVSDGKLIHFTGAATSDKPVADDQFGVRENALKLNRAVEMYQWVEDKHSTNHTNVGGSETTETTYSYRKDWSDRLVESKWFKRAAEHQNPASMPYEGQSFTAPDIRAGAFRLTPDFVSQLKGFTPLPLTQEHYAALPDDLKTMFSLNGGEFFHGNPANPEIGALRVRYTVVLPDTVSVIGKQDGDKVVPYKSTRGDIALIERGELSAVAMFTQAEEENGVITWLLRAGGGFMMFFGLVLVMRPVKVLGDVIPFIGSLLGAGTGLFAFILALIGSTLVIAFAWLAYRPLIGGALLAMAALFLFGGIKKLRGSARNNSPSGLSNETYTHRQS